MAKRGSTNDRPDPVRVRMVACAQLRAEGHNQEEIARRLNLSQPVVSRILNDAIAANLLQDRPTFLTQNAKPAELREARRWYSDQHDKWESAIRNLVPRGHYLQLHTVTAKDFDSFSEHASRHVAQLLRGNLLVGTMWGSTISRIIDGVARCVQPSSSSGLRAIPLAGDPLYLLNQENQQHSASALAAKLEWAFTGKMRSDLPSLYGVPAYISRALMSNRRQATVLKAFIQAVPGYHRIFGPIGFVNQVTTVLTGVGVFATDPNQKSASFLRERESQDGNDFARVRRSILGDFAGNILPKPKLPEDQQAAVASFNRGWLGISLDQLKRIARETGPNSPPGIITVAFGAEDKNAILRESLKRGLVNQLVVDDDLAAALAR